MVEQKYVYVVSLPEPLGKWIDEFAKTQSKEPQEVITEIMSRFAAPDDILAAEIEINKAKIKKLEATKKWIMNLRKNR